MRGILKEKNFETEYLIYGKGKRILFAFHGFNNHAGHLSFLEKTIGNTYTIISVNLFFHGASHADEEMVQSGMTKKQIMHLFTSLMDLFPADKYDLLGYSLGGRFCMYLTSLFPERIETLILIAPDGLRISPFYSLVTQNGPGRNFLKRVVDKPSAFFLTGKLLRSFNLISVKRHQFALNNFDSREKREKVYRVWLLYRNVHFDRSELKALIKKHGISVLMFFGEHDKIIPPSLGKEFQKGNEELIKVTILDSGHRLLTEATGKAIAAQLAATNGV